MHINALPCIRNAWQSILEISRRGPAFNSTQEITLENMRFD